MKKKLESELISIAHRILKLKGKEDINRMHDEVALLYQKLAVLKFAEQNFEGDLPTIGNDSSFFGMLDTAFNNKVSDTVEVEDKVYVNLDEVEDDGITEPVMEKIKDMVAQMPEETQQVDVMVEEAQNQETPTTIEFKDFENLPEFEPIEAANKRQMANQKKSLNDMLKGNSLQIDLNDKLAFVKHLFDGKTEDYDRVISQLNTTTTLQEAQDFITQLVKPDYNNWTAKEDYEMRLMEIIEAKFG